jgi:hypothetical protein
MNNSDTCEESDEEFDDSLWDDLLIIDDIDKELYTRPDFGRDIISEMLQNEEDELSKNIANTMHNVVMFDDNIFKNIVKNIDSMYTCLSFALTCKTIYNALYIHKLHKICIINYIKKYDILTKKMMKYIKKRFIVPNIIMRSFDDVKFFPKKFFIVCDSKKINKIDKFILIANCNKDNYSISILKDQYQEAGHKLGKVSLFYEYMIIAKHTCRDILFGDNKKIFEHNDFLIYRKDHCTCNIIFALTLEDLIEHFSD